MTNHIYLEVGKGVVKKALYLIGAFIVGAGIWAKGQRLDIVRLTAHFDLAEFTRSNVAAAKASTTRRRLMWFAGSGQLQATWK